MTPDQYKTDAAMLGISEERYRKARRKLLGEIARRRTRREIPLAVECRNGPYQGKTIYMTTHETARFCVDGWRGTYSYNGEWRAA